MKNIENKEALLPFTEEEGWSKFKEEDIHRLISHVPFPEVGYLLWTKRNHGEKRVFEFIDALRARHIKHVRTGIAWAEWIEPQGKEWILFYIREYAKHFNLLPTLTFTPPELAIEPNVNAPPKNYFDYGIFVSDVLENLGNCFTHIELWNEWNLDTDWKRELDPDFSIFTDMISIGADVAQHFGKRVVLGGPSKVNPDTVQIFSRLQKTLSPKIDILGFHNLRGTWSDHTPSPPLFIQAHVVQNAWQKNIPVWLTEYGFPVADPEQRFDIELLEKIQVALFAYMVYATLTGDIERAYWYTYQDEVHESLRFKTTGWEDVLQFYYGDTDEQGNQRLLGKLILEDGPLNVLRYAVKEGLMPLVDKASLKRKLPQP